MKYLCLLRGINVGGKNKVSMSELKLLLEQAGFQDVLSYINSGNILLSSDRSAADVARAVEAVITKGFVLESEIIKVRALTAGELSDIITHAPVGFGTKPDTYHSDVAFMIDAEPEDLIRITLPHPEVDKVWAGTSVVYFQRVSALRTKSRMGRIAGTPVYKCITIRNWNTVTKLLRLMQSA